MTNRQRFECAMRRVPPDRVPLDIGATSLTGIRSDCRKRLADLLGFTTDEQIREWAGTDFRAVGAIVDLPGTNARRISATARINCWGVRQEHIDGQWQITHNPLRGCSSDDLDSYPWPEARIDEDLLTRWEQEARVLREQDRYVIIAEHPVFGILELGAWMCGYDEFFLKMAMDPDFVIRFFDKVLAIQLAVIEPYYQVLGPYIDLTMSGDDFGAQNGPLISPEMFEELVAPRFTERIRRTKEIAGCYYWHHSCGSVTKLLDRIIDCGVDILNPVQTSAADMDPVLLKKRFGDRIVFWGGVDVQQFLPRATPEEVRVEIRSLLNAFGENGGYVMAPAHEIQNDVPPENIVAWVESIGASAAGKAPANGGASRS